MNINKTFRQNIKQKEEVYKYLHKISNKKQNNKNIEKKKRSDLPCNAQMCKKKESIYLILRNTFFKKKIIIIVINHHQKNYLFSNY